MSIQTEIAQRIDKALDGDCGYGVGEHLAEQLSSLIAAHDAKVRAETLRGLLSEFGEWADEMTLVVGDRLDEDSWRDTTVREYITQCIDEIEREAGL